MPTIISTSIAGMIFWIYLCNKEWYFKLYASEDAC